MKRDKSGRSARERYAFEYHEARRIERGRSKKRPQEPYKGTRHVALGRAEQAMPLRMLPDPQRNNIGNRPPDSHEFLAMIRRADPSYRPRILEWWRRDLKSWIDFGRKRPIQIP